MIRTVSEANASCGLFLRDYALHVAACACDACQKGNLTQAGPRPERFFGREVVCHWQPGQSKLSAIYGGFASPLRIRNLMLITFFRILCSAGNGLECTADWSTTVGLYLYRSRAPTLQTAARYVCTGADGSTCTCSQGSALLGVERTRLVCPCINLYCKCATYLPEYTSLVAQRGRLGHSSDL